MASTGGADEAWGGGYYELVLELGSRSDDRLLAAIEALWAQPALDGPFAERTLDPAEQPLTHPSVGLSDALFGVGRLHDGARVPCWAIALRPVAGAAGASDGDDLLFGVPLNALAAAWPQVGDFPWGEARADRDWQEPLDEWFANIGRAVFAHVSFRAGWVGFEVSSVSDEVGRRWRKRGVPAERGLGVLWPVGDALSWLPATASARTGVDWSRPPTGREGLRAWMAALRMSLPSRSRRRRSR